MEMNKDVQFRPVTKSDHAEWARLRRILFPNFDPPEIDQFFKTGCFDGFDQCAVFVADAGEGVLAGFAEASARPYAEGCRTTPVAYLEAWFVEEGWRQRGVGARLVAAVEDWGRANGMKEFASDALIDNALSHAAHEALGFGEVERIVCFAKKL